MSRPSETGSTRTFRLIRYRDVSGISGTGVVAYGAQWPGGQVALHWAGSFATTTVFPNIEAVIEIHGHQGATIVEWDRQEQFA
jgi:hypothetical protein